MQDTSSPEKPIRIYTDGCYDCLHIGHANQIQQAKEKFRHVYLLVGVSSKSDIEKNKGTCLQNDQERVQILKHLKWVDEVVFPCPWVITEEFIQKNNIDYVVHDEAPYISLGQEDIYAGVKKMGKFLPSYRTEGISTSDLITRVLSNKQAYFIRNLNRGISREDLGLTWIEEKYYRVKEAINKFGFCQKRKEKTN